MSTWNDGIKEVCKEMAENKARQNDLEWMDDPSNKEKFDKAIESWDKVDKYK